MINRRDFSKGAGGLLTAALAPSFATAQSGDYPNQDIDVVTGFPPGSGADVLTRYFADKVRPIANRTLLVENKVGASGAIAVKYSAMAKPDGYTMYLSAGSATAAQMHLFKTPPVDVIKDFTIAATLNKQAFMIVVDARAPYKTIAELTAAVKKKGKDANWAVAAPSGIVLGEMYKAKAGLEAVEIRYKDASESLNDMLSGRVDYGSHDPVFSLAQAREGRLRILAHSAGQRLQSMPDIPTMTESGVPMDLTGWWAVHLPSATPKPIINQINKWFNQILATQETKEFLNKFGGDPFISTPEDAQALFVREDKAWGEYVKIAKIEPQ